MAPELLLLVLLQIAIAFFLIYLAVRLGVKHALSDDRKEQARQQQRPSGP